MKYGFIGTGNLVQTILAGLHASGINSQYEFFLYDIDTDKAQKVSDKYNIPMCPSASETVANSDVVVLGIKPNQLFPLLDDIAHEVRIYLPTLISLPVGIAIDTIEKHLGFSVPIVRIVPNVNAQVFLSTTCFCENEMAAAKSAELKQGIMHMLGSIGTVSVIPENQFDIFTVIASSAPAFVVKFAESLSQAALKEGIPIETARQIVAHMLHGTGETLKTCRPQDLIDTISSPGGTTIEGSLALTASGFETAIHHAVASCICKLKLNEK